VIRTLQGIDLLVESPRSSAEFTPIKPDRRPIAELNDRLKCGREEFLATLGGSLRLARQEYRKISETFNASCFCPLDASVTRALSVLFRYIRPKLIPIAVEQRSLVRTYPASGIALTNSRALRNEGIQYQPATQTTCSHRYLSSFHRLRRRPLSLPPSLPLSLSFSLRFSRRARTETERRIVNVVVVVVVVDRHG